MVGKRIGKGSGRRVMEGTEKLINVKFNGVMQRITFLSISAVLLAVIMANTTINEIRDNEVMAISVEASQLSINDSIHPNIEDNEVLMCADEGIAVYSEDDERLKLSESRVSYAQDPYAVITQEFTMIKEGNQEIITKYFGNSEVFSPEVIMDRVSATTITFINTVTNDNGVSSVTIHIDTLDYDLMNSDFKSLETIKTETLSLDEMNSTNYIDEIKREIANRLINGNYDICYTITVDVANGSVIVNEAIKQAITGGWYKGVGIALEKVSCIK